jgi:hypothetical protein
VIKAFNGGGVKAKNCYFWKIDEKPLQGNATAEGCTNAEPPSHVIASANVASEHSARKVEPGTTPPPKSHPGVTPPAAGTPSATNVVATARPMLPRNLEPQRAALRTILLRTQASSTVKANITLFGKLENVSFAGADETWIKVTMDGNTLPLRWKDVPDVDLARLVLSCHPEDIDTLFNAGIVAFANHKDSFYENILTQLLKINADRAVSLLDVCNGN